MELAPMCAYVGALGDRVLASPNCGELDVTVEICRSRQRPPLHRRRPACYTRAAIRSRERPRCETLVAKSLAVRNVRGVRNVMANSRELQSVTTLDAVDTFVDRHLGPSHDETREML